MNRKFACAGAMFAMLSLAGVARADSITFLDSSSGIAVLAHAYEGGVDVRRSLPFTRSGVITQLLTAEAGTVTTSASASLDSKFSDLAHMSGFGSATAAVESASGSGDVSGSSQFAVRFQLPSYYAYDFDATFRTTGDRSQETNGFISVTDRGWVLASLYRDALVGGYRYLTPVFSGEWFNDAELARDGVLTPGTYYLFLQAAAVGWNAPPGFASINASSNFAFRFDLTQSAAPVPEPASLLLFGTGLVGTIARLRLRRRRG